MSPIFFEQLGQMWRFCCAIACVGLLIAGLLAGIAKDEKKNSQAAGRVFLASCLLAVAGPFGAAYLSVVLMKLTWKRFEL